MAPVSFTIIYSFQKLLFLCIFNNSFYYSFTFHGYFDILSYFLKKSIDFSEIFVIIIMFVAKDKNKTT
ncbi:MAG TPA: hypothetical protein DCZ20_11290 [Lachnospiraceae bacterium]|nr:hypothetical protein [Lachnospiraceae bacterium]